MTFDDIVDGLDFDAAESEDIERQFRLREAEKKLREGPGVFATSQTQVCVWCGGEIEGKRISTREGALHPECLDHWEGMELA